MVREQMFSAFTYGRTDMRKLVVSSRNIYFASKNVNVMEWKVVLGLLTA